MNVEVNGINRDARHLTIGVQNNTDNNINQTEFKREFENKINKKEENNKIKINEDKSSKIDKNETDNKTEEKKGDTINKKEFRNKENNDKNEGKGKNKGINVNSNNNINNKINKSDLKFINKITINEKMEEIIERFGNNTKKINQSKQEIKENFSKLKDIKSNSNLKDIFLKQTETKNKLSEKKNINTEKQETENKLIDVKTNGKAESKKVKEQLSFETKTLKPQKNNNFVKNNKIEVTINDLTNSKEIYLDLKEFKIHKISNLREIIENYSTIKDKIVNSVENSIKFLISNNDNKVLIKLHPPELGKIQIELVVKDNNVEAKINTENHHVREVILSNLDQLKSNLNNSGFQISKFNVEVGGFKNFFEQNFNNAEGNSKKHGNTFRGVGNYSLNSEVLGDDIQLNSIPNFYSGKVINIVI